MMGGKAATANAVRGCDQRRVVLPGSKGPSDRQSAGLDLCHVPSPPHIRSVHTKVPPEGDKHANPRPETAIFTEYKPCQTFPTLYRPHLSPRRSETSLPEYGV